MLGNDARNGVTETRVGVETGTHRSAAECQLAQTRAHRAQGRQRSVELGHPSRDRLPEHERRGILQMGASDHDYVGKRFLFFVQRCAQCLNGRKQAMVELGHGRDVHHGREYVVGGLAAVDIIVRMHRRFAAELSACERDRTVGNHLVGIHVRLRAGSGLENAQRKFAVELAVDHFLRGAGDKVHLVRGELSQHSIGNCGALLDHTERANDRSPPAEAVERDREIDERALRLRAPQVIGGYRHFSQRILFDTHSRRGA